MGCGASSQSPSFPHWTDTQYTVLGAGCMFVNDTHTLAGIHTPRRNREVRLCGFGGKTLPQEPWWQTAFRETVEELFHRYVIPYNLYHALKQITPYKILEDKETPYITLVYTFDQLNVFLAICQKHLLETAVYTVFPRSAEDLVFKRHTLNHVPAEPNGVEIMDIVFWPIHNAHRRFRVSKDFAADMRRLTCPV